MQVCLMIEGQEDVTWQQWVSLAETCEKSGIPAMFRSDHYVSVMDKEGRGSLDAWSTINGLAGLTSRLNLGTMVSPATFRHPSVLAKSVVTADHISGGRVELGLGIGWHDVEHTQYGFPFPDVATRMQRYTEQIEIIHRQWTEDSFSFKGDHYEIENLSALPKPVRDPHPNLIAGGDAGPRSAAVAARWADEYNTHTGSIEECRSARDSLDRACRDANRDPATLPLSLMTTCVLGGDDKELLNRVQAQLERTGDADTDPAEFVESRGEAHLVGTMDTVANRLEKLAEASVTRVMCQHLVHDDLEMVEMIGELGRRVA
jgi:F420-dependent oxidoreductase-like protein